MWDVGGISRGDSDNVGGCTLEGDGADVLCFSRGGNDGEDTGLSAGKGDGRGSFWQWSGTGDDWW
jgi:hypothetical protein